MTSHDITNQALQVESTFFPTIAFCFQQTMCLMENILQGIPQVTVYLDDALIAGRTEAEHRMHLEMVLTRLQQAGLWVNKDKCFFMVKAVEYLGHAIDAEGLYPLPGKVEAVQNAPSPQDVSQLRSYLGLLTYYSKFLPKLSTVVVPLNQLLSASKPWKWTEVQERAFQASKQLLLTSDVLVHYDPNLELVLSCDASSYGVGAVLSHRMSDGTERPVGFASRTLTPAEKKYSQIEKESLVYVFGVKHFHNYLYGCHFTICTDHKPLISLFNELKAISAQASGHIQWWSLTVAAYQYNIVLKVHIATWKCRCHCTQAMVKPLFQQRPS